jgi:hypothetical protein
VIHEAGALVDGVQRCVRCDYILTDYRDAMVPEDSPPLFGWAVGASIEVFDGNPRHSVVVDARPDCHEIVGMGNVVL